MIKVRQITVTQVYKVCDECGEEITDYSSTVLESKSGLPDKHFHNMHRGGQKGTVGRTCIELFESHTKEV